MSQDAFARSGTDIQAEACLPGDFKTYKEYRTNLQRIYGEVERETLPTTDHADLWLAHFNDQGQTSGWNRHSGPRSDYTVGPRRIQDDPYHVVEQRQHFVSLLKTSDNTVAYQIVILFADTTFWEPRTLEWVEDVLGLGLDLEYDIFDSIVWGQHSQRPMLLEVDSPVLSIGHHRLAILDAIPAVRPRTVVLCVSGISIEETRNELRYNWINYAASIPPPRPSTCCKGFETNVSARWNLRDAGVSFIRKYLTTKDNNLSVIGQVGQETACIAGLIELQLHQPSCLIPVISTTGLQLRDSDEGDTGLDPISLWIDLTNEIAHQKTTIAFLPQMIKRSFRSQPEGSENIVQKLITRFQVGLKELEDGEEVLKNYLALVSTQKSTDMAERSIQESKRVMLLTSLAFIFIPISLAASIFGMNVQEVNSTGHSITAFAVTAVVMCATALISWGCMASFVSWRKQKQRQLIEENEEYNSIWTVIIVQGLWDGRHTVFWMVKGASIPKYVRRVKRLLGIKHDERTHDLD